MNVSPALLVALAAALAAVILAIAARRQAAAARAVAAAADARQRAAEAHAAAIETALTDTRQQLHTLDAEREHLFQEFRDAQRLEAIGRLVGGVAHDFNNQLTSIIGYTELLLWDVKEDDPKRPDLLEVRRAADRANIITQQLLAFTRSQPRQQATVNLADSLLGSIRLLKRVLGPDIQFTSSFERDAAVLHLDAGLLGHALLNLGVRARDRMPAGGTIAFDTAQVTIAAPDLVALPVPEPGRYATLTMRLTPNDAPPPRVPSRIAPQTPAQAGHAAQPGSTPAASLRAAAARPMPPDDRSDSATADDPGGAIAGADARAMNVVRQILALSQGAVVLHAGVPDAQGRPTPRGESVTLYLPCVPEYLQDAVIPAAPRGTETVLVVDDEPVVRDLTRTLLERHGYRVLTADRPSDAQRRAREMAGSLDLLVTDILLPEVRGDQLAARLKADGSSVRVLYMSGNDVAAPDLDGPLTPHGAFLLKPFTPDQLLIAVRQALDAPPPPIAPNVRG